MVAIEEGKLVKIKDKLGVVMIPQKPYTRIVSYKNGVIEETHYTLNNVLLEDNTIIMVDEDTITEINEIEGSV